jgi:hypothetical protein
MRRANQIPLSGRSGKEMKHGAAAHPPTSCPCKQLVIEWAAASPQLAAMTNALPIPEREPAHALRGLRQLDQLKAVHRADELGLPNIERWNALQARYRRRLRRRGLLGRLELLVNGAARGLRQSQSGGTPCSR